MSSTMLQPSDAQISYHEPSLPSLLTLLSFLYLLNIFRSIASYLLNAGLLGEIAIGIIYGPVAKILPLEWEQTFLVLGYIGLVLIVFEGGLTLDVKGFLPLLPIAFGSALVGILLPLAFTFALFSAPSYGYPTIEAFTAGSALASTSLGTTFFVLKSAAEGGGGGGGSGGNLEETRIAMVLKGAALIDDIVALVLLSVISSLGEGEGGGTGGGLGWTIGRPIVASLAMCLVTPIVLVFVLKPLFGMKLVRGWMEKGGKEVKLGLGVLVLSAYLAIAYYAGTTVLLGSFLAGLTLPFLSAPSSSSSPSFLDTYQLYIEPLQTYILVPFFFGSIGYSIPFLELWTGQIVWKGIVYSILMLLGKLLVGGCIVLNDLILPPKAPTGGGTKSGKEEEKNSSTSTPTNTLAERGSHDKESLPLSTPSSTERTRRETFMKETLPASAFLGTALVARGEIGILVLQVAYNSSSSSSSNSTRVLGTEAYLVSIWAVTICTILGPIGFGRLVKSRWGREGVMRGKWN
ncbi:cation:proton antiporter [Sporobolomyces salmoneus]|uniref:cation:proton antiporter n=1 Tax=Sporobolomyces salmoneus TaxID=183962 RepID=UPI0031731938